MSTKALFFAAVFFASLPQVMPQTAGSQKKHRHKAEAKMLLPPSITPGAPQITKDFQQCITGILTRLGRIQPVSGKLVHAGINTDS